MGHGQESDRIQFLKKERTQLWKDAGVETPSIRTKTKKASRPAKASAARPEKLGSLEEVRHWLGDCERCGLHKTRNKIVFGEGNLSAQILFVGEGPGADEDEQGRPFVGRAGQLLTKIIEAMGYTRSQVYIANVVKCRPPGNRAPQPDEVASCSPFLQAQVEIIKPKVVVALGATSASLVLNYTGAISSIRGKWQPLPWQPKVLVMPTYHPAYLLRNPSAKKTVWDDMKLVLDKVGKTK